MLLRTLRDLIAALAEPVSDWSAIEQAWLDVSLEAAGTEYEGLIQDTAIAIRLHDVEHLIGLFRAILVRAERSSLAPL